MLLYSVIYRILPECLPVTSLKDERRCKHMRSHQKKETCSSSLFFLWLNENPVPLRRRREEESKRLKDKESKSQRGKESKRLKDKESKSRKDKKKKGERQKPRKPLEEYGGCAAAVMLPFWSYKSKLLTPNRQHPPCLLLEGCHSLQGDKQK